MYFYYLLLIMCFCNISESEKVNTKPEKIIVFYDDYYKIQWFSSFSNYKVSFIRTNYKSNYATNIIHYSDFNSNIYKIYLTTKPLLYDTHNIKNYHIKGLSYLKRNQSVITIQKMSDVNVTRVILHEFAHGKGLNHCVHKDCIMNDAKGKFINLKDCNSFKESCEVFVKQNTFLAFRRKNNLLLACLN